MMNFRTGFRFSPTDEELVRGYLFPKVIGAPLPWDAIVHRDVYGPKADPWVVFSDADDDEDSSLLWTTRREGGVVKKSIYVFTRVPKASNKPSARCSRVAGSGTWSGQSGPKEILHSDSRAVIGCSRMLAFEFSKKEMKKKELGHWIMHEYCLDGEGLKAARVESTDIVVCKITKCVRESDRRRPSQPPAAVAEQFGCLPAEGNRGSTKKRGGEELLEEEGCSMKKHKPSLFDNNGGNNGGDAEINMDMMGDFDFSFDFDFDFNYGNID